MTDNAAQAAELILLARQKNCVLQVGHIERFNPIFKYLESVASEPRFIETHRLSPYPARSTDIGVVLDLMIHDLDVVLAFVKSPITHVDAVGIPVLSTSEDMANARLHFANGCVAETHRRSRISPEKMRKIRVFSGGVTSYVTLDYRAQEGYIYRIARDGEEESSLLKKLLAAKDSTIVSEFGGKRIVCVNRCPSKKSSPEVELQSFVDCVRARQTPVVSGRSANSTLDRLQPGRFRTIPARENKHGIYSHITFWRTGGLVHRENSFVAPPRQLGPRMVERLPHLLPRGSRSRCLVQFLFGIQGHQQTHGGFSHSTRHFHA